jgi:citrate lyase subunit beta/citryl-CoA lyase
MSIRPLRSALYVPAANEKALGKLPSLDMDAVIVDLEDAVHPDAKASARELMVRTLKDWHSRKALLVVRINPLDGSDGHTDLKAALDISPDAILLPKVEAPSSIHTLSEALSDLDADPAIRIWAMIETRAPCSIWVQWPSLAIITLQD